MEMEMKMNKEMKGVIIMAIAAILTAFGQLAWKIGLDKGILLILLGFVIYGMGALTMMIALKCGELSRIYPIMCVGYIIALLNGKLFLDESINGIQFVGIVCIVIGVIFMGRGEQGEV